MTTDFFIMILGEAVASPKELSKLRAFQPELLCFAASEFTDQHISFLRTTQTPELTANDCNICQEAKNQAMKNPQTTVILHKSATGQLNLLSFRQAAGGCHHSKKSLVEKLAEIEEMLFGYRQVSQLQPLLCQAIVHHTLSDKDRNWIKSLENAIEQHLRQASLKVEELASIACLSKRQLNRRLQSVLGVTPAQLIREVQLQLAWQELANGKPESVIQVALNSGFEHASTFSTLFKQRFGRSPKQCLAQ